MCVLREMPKRVSGLNLLRQGVFTGGIVGGGIVGAALSTSAVGGLCVGLGVPTGGLGSLVCSIVVVGVGSFSSSAIGGAVGEKMGERIFEATQ